jgi:aminomethyltransferase
MRRRAVRVPYDSPQVRMYTRRIRKSPYFYASRRHGAQSYSERLQPHVHPRHYDDMIAEYWKLVNDVTLWDVGVERQVDISGPRLTRVEVSFIVHEDAVEGVDCDP